MVCGPEIKQSIKQILRLPAVPRSSSTWKDSLLRCTYPLDAGKLVLTVKKSADNTAAIAYFNSRKSTANDISSLKGLSSLGLPAYQTTGGVASFVKDDMTLEVDATALTPTVGPEGTTRSEFASTIASNVLACWTEH